MRDTLEWAIRRTGLPLPTPVFGPRDAWPAEEAERAPTAAERNGAVAAAALALIAALGLLYTLYLARQVILPVVIAILLSFLLRGPVRWLRRHRVREPVGAALVVFGGLIVAVVVMLLLVGPATSWLARAPTVVEQADQKLRTLVRPLLRFEATAARVEQIASGATTGTGAAAPAAPVASPTGGILRKAFGGAANLLVVAVSIIFLTYFLLASGDLFMRKLMKVLPYREEHSGVPQRISDEVEAAVSAYLRTSLLINVGLGFATWGILQLLGMPNAGLWGAMAGVLNVVPYLGALLTAGVLAVAAITVFDSIGHALLVPMAFFFLNIIESNVVTPMLMGRTFPLNPVALFIGVLVWGFVWGIPGAILAVPIMVTLKILCDHIPALRPFGEFLGQ
ncbi:MAG: AI-2E family transporter [Gemmatimonadaceae bacterium]|nr:AI-2E family transporter [Gemmatimonadaceae bacterium]